jgi:hypothetical protein
MRSSGLSHRKYFRDPTEVSKVESVEMRCEIHRNSSSGGGEVPYLPSTLAVDYRHHASDHKCIYGNRAGMFRIVYGAEPVSII